MRVIVAYRPQGSVFYALSRIVRYNVNRPRDVQLTTGTVIQWFMEAVNPELHFGIDYTDVSVAIGAACGLKPPECPQELTYVERDGAIRSVVVDILTRSESSAGSGELN